MTSDAATTPPPSPINISRDAMFTELYDQLRMLARSRLRTVGGRTYLGTTALVHGTYERLAQTQGHLFQSNGQFMAYCAQVMRSVIIDVMRAYQTERRGSGEREITLNMQLLQQTPEAETESFEALRVHEALAELREIDAKLVDVVEMRFFAGFTDTEIAAALGVSERSVQRLWVRARGLLRAMIE